MSAMSVEQPQATKTAEGRKKIKIARIVDARSRQVTFLKRKNGLLKKAMELGILCDCEVTVIIFNVNNGKLFEYSSVPIEKALQRYATYSGPSERRKTDKFFDLASSKGNTNIPLHEPILAQAAIDAASAAIRRPRPFHKFNQNTPTDIRINGKRLSSGETPPSTVNPSERNPFTITSDIPVDANEQRPAKFLKPETLVNAPHAVPYRIAVYSQSQTHSQTLSQSHSQAYSVTHSQSHSQSQAQSQPHPLQPPAPMHLSHPPPAMARPPLAASVTPRCMAAIPFQPNMSSSAAAAAAVTASLASPATGSLSAFLGLSPTASKDSDGAGIEMKEGKSAQSAAQELAISKSLSQYPLQTQAVLQNEDGAFIPLMRQNPGDIMTPPDDSRSASLAQGDQPQLTLSMFTTAQLNVPHPTSLLRSVLADDGTLPPPWTMNDAEAPPAAMLACRSESSHGIVAGMTGLVDSETDDRDCTAVITSTISGGDRAAMLGSEAVSVRHVHEAALDETEEEVAAPAVTSIRSRESKCDPVEMVPLHNLRDCESPNRRKSLNTVEPLPSMSRDDMLKDDILDTTPSGLHSLVTPSSGEENIAFPSAISLSRLPSNISGTGSLTCGPPWTSWVNQIFPLVPDSISKVGEQSEVAKAKEQTKGTMDGADPDTTSNKVTLPPSETMPETTFANARDSMMEPLPTSGIDAIDTTGTESVLPSFMETDLTLSRAGSNDSSSGVAPLIMRTLSNMPFQSLTSRGMSFDTLLSAPPTVRSPDGDEITTVAGVMAGGKKPLM